MNERGFEDWLVANPEQVFGKGVEILGRQVALPNGILDVLAWDEGSILVIELKASRLKPQDVAQVLRYAGDIGNILRHEGASCPFEYGTPQFDRWIAYYCIEQQDNLGGCAIEPVLIGRHADEKVMAAASGAACSLYTWGITAQGHLYVDHQMLKGEHRIPNTPRWFASLLNKIDTAINEE